MWQTHHCLAMALSRNGQHEGALASAHNAIRIAPNQHQTHFALGYAALNAGHKTLAHDAFKHVLALDPDNSAAHNNLAKLGMDQGRLLRAAHGFSASLAANPHSATARYNVDVLARHLMRWVHYAMLGLCLLLEAFVPQDTTDPTGPLPIADAPPGSGATTAPNTHATASSGWLALLTPALFVAFVGAVVVLDRRLPRALRGYYRRLPRTDRYLGAWLALDLIAFGLLLALGIPQSPTNRSGLDGFAFMVLIAGVLVSRVGASHMKKRRAALPS
jgi:tetratricopeptide (TPR) repeat protein